jgi:hypothetical protein
MPTCPRGSQPRWTSCWSTRVSSTGAPARSRARSRGTLRPACARWRARRRSRRSGPIPRPGARTGWCGGAAMTKALGRQSVVGASPRRCSSRPRFLPPTLVCAGAARSGCRSISRARPSVGLCGSERTRSGDAPVAGRGGAPPPLVLAPARRLRLGAAAADHVWYALRIPGPMGTGARRRGVRPRVVGEGPLAHGACRRRLARGQRGRRVRQPPGSAT